MSIASGLNCSVCTETFNTTARGRVECPQCKKDACRACYRRYLTSRFQEPCCMHCSVAFKMEHIHDSFPRTFWTNDYKKHREKTLFSLEMSQCAATLPYLQMVADHDIASAELRTCHREIADITKVLKQKKSQERALQTRVQATAINTRLVVKPSAHNCHVPCSTPQCRGFVTKDTPNCACCNQITCHSCHQSVENPTLGKYGHETPEPTGHVCSEDNIATVLELRRNAKQCPECRVYISKVDGCDQMFCVSCHTAFSWNTGLRINGPIHNPHYFEVRARLGNVGPAATNQANLHGRVMFPGIHSLRREVNNGQRLEEDVELLVANKKLRDFTTT